MCALSHTPFGSAGMHHDSLCQTTSPLTTMITVVEGDCILHLYAKLRDDVIKYLSTVTLKHSAQPEVKLSLFVKTDGYEKLKYEARRKVFAGRLSMGQTTHCMTKGQRPNGLVRH